MFDKFTELLLQGVRKLKVGDPMQESTDVPPLIREQDAVRVSEWIEEAVKGGAKLLCGGKHKGSVVEPTVLTDTSPDMRVNCAEIFAPVVTVEPYEEFRRRAAPGQRLALRIAGRSADPRRRAHPDGIR